MFLVSSLPFLSFLSSFLSSRQDKFFFFKFPSFSDLTDKRQASWRQVMSALPFYLRQDRKKRKDSEWICVANRETCHALQSNRKKYPGQGQHGNPWGGWWSRWSWLESWRSRVRNDDDSSHSWDSKRMKRYLQTKRVVSFTLLGKRVTSRNEMFDVFERNWQMYCLILLLVYQEFCDFGRDSHQW